MNPAPVKNHQRARIIMLAIATLTIFAASYFASKSLDHAVKISYPQEEQNQRIIALSPSSVEIVYQLGLDNQLVGVSRFCKYPDEAKNKPVVGGYLDLDFEAVLRLKPNIVILLNEQSALAERLEQLGIQTISVDHASTDGILRSIPDIGDPFGKAEESKTIVSGIKKRMENVTRRSKQVDSKPRVLVCIDRDTSASHPARIIAAGNAGVHQEYITMAGGENAYQGNIAYPSISREKLIQMNPDIIIDLITEDVWKKSGQEKLLQTWGSYSELKAIQNQHIIFLHDNKHLIPGPRFTDTLEAFSKAIQSSQP